MNRDRYLQLIEPAMAIVVKKHQDYGNASLGLHSYFPFGEVSYVQMLHVKTQRLVSLAKHAGESDYRPHFEGVQDTLKDLINYAVFMLDYMDKLDSEQPL